MTTGSIPVAYHQTGNPRKSSSRRFQLRDLDIKIKPIIDIAGSVDARGLWQQQVDDAHIVFHLFRADQFITGDQEAISRVINDAQHVNDWIKKRNSCKLFLVGTHCDLDPAFRGIAHERHGDYLDKFRQIPDVAELVMRHGGDARPHLIIGSMKSQEDTEYLVEEIFKTMSTLG